MTRISSRSRLRFALLFVLACSLGQTSALAEDPQLPPPRRQAGYAEQASHEGKPGEITTLPIDLPYALRLVNASNPTIAIARERVREAYARQQQARVLWVPNLWAGGNPDNLAFLPTFYVHNGNLQNARGAVFEQVKANVAFPV